MAPGHEVGFGFLRDVAVDQHVLVRERLGDLPTVLARHADLLGIGIDEGTAIVVQRDTATVIGVSRVFVYGGRDVPDSGQEYRSLRAGDRYDLRDRRQVSSRAQRGILGLPFEFQGAGFVEFEIADVQRSRNSTNPAP